MLLTPATAQTTLFAVLLVLCLKALLLGMATAAMRGKSKSFMNQEDAEWLGGAHNPVDPDHIGRIGRAHRNDLENLLLFAITGGIVLLLGAAPLAITIYALGFLLARLLHTLAYLKAMPLLRRNAYTLGFVIIIAQAVHSAVVMLG